MGPIRERSLKLTAALEALLRKSKYFVAINKIANVNEPRFTIITPEDPSQRGAQLSLLFLPHGGTMQKIFKTLGEYGVIGDEREPDVIRLAPAPLYNTLEDCEKAVFYLEEAFKSLDNA